MSAFASHDYHLEKNEPSGSRLEFLGVRAKVRVVYRCDVRASTQCLVYVGIPTSHRIPRAGACGSPL